MTTKAAKEEALPTPPASNKSKPFALGVTFTIAVIALGGAFFAIQKTEELQQLNKQVTEIKQQQMQTNTVADSLSKAISENQNDLKKQLSTVDKQLQIALQQHFYQTKDWLFLKVRYYLELAQINAQWSDNAEITQAILQQADALLATVHDQGLFKIRQAIASEITQLKTIQTLDVVGMLSRLDAAVDDITTLTLRSSVQTLHQQNATTQLSTTSAWREQLDKSMDFLKTLIVVRRQKEDIQPLPSPAEEPLLRGRIQLNLQEAQWAILEHNDAVYQWSLTQAIKQISHSFSGNDPKTQAVVTQLNELLTNHLTRPKNLLNQSLPLLNQFIESKDQTNEKSS